MGSWLKVPQRRLGQMGLLLLLACTSWAMPLSLDMYTPAIPHMAEHLNTNASMVNLTLVGYHFFFAVGLLLFGPLSDRVGRKPVLAGGLFCFTAASVLCAAAPTIEVLIAARILQALGAGAADAMTNSVIKDSFVEERRQVAISFVQLMLILGPVIAPLAGAAIVTHFGWRGTFVALAAIGALCCVLAVLFSETLPAEDRTGVEDMGIVGQFVGVLRNPGFTFFLLVSSVFNIGFMAYVAVASYIYITFFGLPEMGYSIYFSLTALFTVLGPFAWELASRWMSEKNFFTLALGISLASGVAILAFGRMAPIAFALAFMAFAVVEAAARPLSVNILLSQDEDLAGTASSCINFVYTVVGSLGMLLMQLPFPDYVSGLGMLIVATIVAATLGWVVLLRSGVRVKGLKG